MNDDAAATYGPLQGGCGSSRRGQHHDTLYLDRLSDQCCRRGGDDRQMMGAHASCARLGYA